MKSILTGLTVAVGLGFAMVATTPLPTEAAATPAAFEAMEDAIDSAKGAFTATDVGKNAKFLGGQLTKAKGFVHKAAGLAGASAKNAGKELKKADRAFKSIGFRLRSLTGRKTIPQATRDALTALLKQLSDQLRALRGML